MNDFFSSTKKGTSCSHCEDDAIISLTKDKVPLCETHFNIVIIGITKIAEQVGILGDKVNALGYS